MKSVKCRDCGKVLTPDQVRAYRALGMEIQRIDNGFEAICNDCLDRRLDNENVEDLIAEFCG